MRVPGESLYPALDLLRYGYPCKVDSLHDCRAAKHSARSAEEILILGGISADIVIGCISLEELLTTLPRYFFQASASCDHTLISLVWQKKESY